MSLREGRDSHGKRLRSRSDRERHSPKRSRRDGKLATERTYSDSNNLEIGEQTGSNRKRSRNFQHALPFEADPAPESKAQLDLANKELEKAGAFFENSKHFSDPTDVPRSRSYFQHDECGSAVQGDRSFGHRATENRVPRPWDDPNQQSSRKVKEKSIAEDFQEKEGKVPDIQRKDEGLIQMDDSVWRHDKYHELEVDPPPARRRPAFRENKLPTEEPASSAKESETVKASRYEQPRYGSARRDEQGGYPRRSQRTEKTFAGANDRICGDGRPLHWREMWRDGYQSRERCNAGHGVRDRYDARHHERNQHQPGGLQADRWKHDLFDETNRSPAAKNEDEEIAKVEALLAL